MGMRLEIAMMIIITMAGDIMVPASGMDTLLKIGSIIGMIAGMTLMISRGIGRIGARIIEMTGVNIVKT